MRHALELAWRGWGRVSPNPLVGAVVLRGDETVAEGWHAEYGGPHAELAALYAAGEKARGATLVVSLEPCAHHGKTPPCTDAIRAAGVRRVVAAVRDPDAEARMRKRAAVSKCSSAPVSKRRSARSPKKPPRSMRRSCLLGNRPIGPSWPSSSRRRSTAASRTRAAGRNGSPDPRRAITSIGCARDSTRSRWAARRRCWTTRSSRHAARRWWSASNPARIMARHRRAPMRSARPGSGASSLRCAIPMRKRAGIA